MGQTNAKKRKVAILGFTDHRAIAFDLPHDEWEVWGLNELYRYEAIEKFDRWFEIHDRAVIDPDKKHIEDLGKITTIPIYMQAHYNDIPHSVPLPKERIEKALGDFGMYQTSSISWMLGMALLEGFKEIGVFGVDMAQECPSPDTPVLTSDLRWVPAGDLKVGDKLLAYDEEQGIGTQSMHELTAAAEGSVATAIKVRAVARQWRIATVLGADTIKKRCYRIHLADGTTLVASENHRWLTRTKHMHRWRKTRDLITKHHRDDRPTRLVRVLQPWSGERSHERGYLAAAFDGEGTLAQTSHRGRCNGYSLQLSFCQKENAMAAEVRRCLQSLGYHWSEQPHGGGTTNFNILGGRSQVIRFLGEVRPLRLLDKFRPQHLGSMQRIATVPVVELEDLGEQDVIALNTSEKTFIGDGFASHNSEYAEQRNCVEWLLGIAVGRGIKIHVPPNSDLLKAIGQYGYGFEGKGFMLKLQDRMNWLKREELGYVDAIARLDKQYEEKRGGLDKQYHTKKAELTLNLNHVQGAGQDCSYWKRSWAVPQASDNKSGPTPDRSKDEKTGVTQEAAAAAG